MLPKSPYPAVTPSIQSLYLVFTNKCNLTCKHCCVWSSPRGSHGLELPIAIRVIDDTVKLYGKVRMVLGGGEPLIRLHDALMLLKRSINYGMNTLLLTNGMLINARVAALLAQIDGLRIRISLDGTTKERHDFIRGAGSFDKTLEGIAHLKSSEYKFKNLEIACTIYPGWEDEMENILLFCEELEICTIKLKALSKLGRAIEFWPAIPVSTPDEDTRVYRERLGAGLYETYKERWNVVELNDFSFGELNVYYDGSVYAYSFMGDADQRNARLGNVRDSSLEDILRNESVSRAVVQKFLAHATGPRRSLQCLNLTRV